tara:strand:+ start:1636 stop:1806 length:171 start_codon:yes stop_codon:yes gene_type:complete
MYIHLFEFIFIFKLSNLKRIKKIITANDKKAINIIINGVNIDECIVELSMSLMVAG